jgi:hypothetical protein
MEECESGKLGCKMKRLIDAALFAAFVVGIEAAVLAAAYWLI